MVANLKELFYFSALKIYEKNVFPYKNVISYCYAKDMDNQTLYRAKYLESSKMKDCLSLAVK